MSKLTNHTEKAQVAGYGLHYHANNLLIPNTSDRVLFQYIIDVVRNQLSKSSSNQTIIISAAQLARVTGLDAYRTIPICMERLEKLGLIKKHKNGMTIMCDEYVTLVQHIESLSPDDKKSFSKDFSRLGTEILQKCKITINEGCRTALLGMTGSSIPLKTCNNVGFSTPEPQNPTFLQGSQRYLDSKPYNNVGFHESQMENPTILQGAEQEDSLLLQNTTPTFLQDFVEEIVETLHFCRGYATFEEFCESLPPTFLQGWHFEFIKSAFLQGLIPESLKTELQEPYIFAGGTPTFLQGLASKTLHFCRTVIIYNNKIYNKRDELQKDEVIEDSDKDYSRDIQKGFEGFGKVEVIDFDKPSEKIEEDFMEVEDISRQTLKRAERSMRARNSYRNKPFIKVERIKEIVDCLDEVVKSPVDFFLYQFWWGIFDLYCEHYHPSSRIDEEGEVEDEPQSTDWKEMIGAALPQDEVYALAKNVYEDMLGAVEQGKYVYGDNNEWEVKFGFKTFQDFNPYEIFQWSPCTMQDKSVPALKVAIDRFYDIEASDVFTSSKGDKKTKNSQNKKLISLILSADDSSLSPMEKAIKAFYRDFVVSGDENIIDEFTDGKGITLESGGGLPDHLLKPWCYNLPSVGYNELTGVLCSKYKPCDGIHKKAYIFSAESVVEWNERNGYTDTIAHKSLQ